MTKVWILIAVAIWPNANPDGVNMLVLSKFNYKDQCIKSVKTAKETYPKLHCTAHPCEVTYYCMEVSK